MPLTAKGEKILNSMTAPPGEGGYGSKKGEQVFYASRNKGTITGVDSMSGKLGNFSKEQARVFGNSPVVRSRADATPPLHQRGPGGETWKPSGSPIDAHLDSMRKGFKK